jgi:hypothetical protein
MSVRLLQTKLGKPAKTGQLHRSGASPPSGDEGLDRFSVPVIPATQLVLCATHRCIGVTCRPAKVSGDAAPLLQSETPDRVQLSVEMAISSASMAYGVARCVIIPRQHLLNDAHAAEEGQILKGKDAIPFRHARRPWIVDCEAVRVGTQVFGIFHADSPPQSHRDQLRLF